MGQTPALCLPRVTASHSSVMGASLVPGSSPLLSGPRMWAQDTCSFIFLSWGDSACLCRALCQALVTGRPRPHAGAPRPLVLLKDLQLRVLCSPGSHPWGVAGPRLLPAQAPSALQALRRDQSVPWTGMLAIVRSYLTHKSGGTGRAPAPSPAPAPSRPIGLLWPGLWERARVGPGAGQYRGRRVFQTPRVQPGHAPAGGCGCRRPPGFPG